MTGLRHTLRSFFHHHSYTIPKDIDSNALEIHVTEIYLYSNQNVYVINIHSLYLFSIFHIELLVHKNILQLL